MLVVEDARVVEGELLQRLLEVAVLVVKVEDGAQQVLVGAAEAALGVAAAAALGIVAFGAAALGVVVVVVLALGLGPARTRNRLPVPRTLPGLTPSRRRGLKSNSPTRET